MAHKTADIDLVYLYVNSSDKAWAARRNQYAMDQNNHVCRFRNNNELMYSLRSVEKYAPWIRNIFIVSDSAMPDWLNLDHPKIHVIDHREIMPPDILPCFNSNVIQAHLWRIPGLSEIFLYADDDMFFTGRVSPRLFVKDGKPVVQMIKQYIKPNVYYFKVILNARKILVDHGGKENDLIPWHNIDVYTKKGMEKCVKKYQKEFETEFQNHIRKDNNIQRVIFHYDLLSQNACILKIHDTTSRIKRRIDYIRMIFSSFTNSRYLSRKMWDINLFFKVPFYHRILFKHMKCGCLNDSEGTTEEDLIKYRDFMEKLFPKKSSFEK